MIGELFSILTQVEKYTMNEITEDFRPHDWGAVFNRTRTATVSFGRVIDFRPHDWGAFFNF